MSFKHNKYGYVKVNTKKKKNQSHTLVFKLYIAVQFVYRDYHVRRRRERQQPIFR